jgi:hypothetical protein
LYACPKTDLVPPGDDKLQELPEETAESPLEIREVAERALVLQRYLLRRAWAVPYATWAVAIFLTNFGALFEALLGLSVLERIAVSTLASGAALTITLRAFKRVRDTAEIRRLVNDGKWRRVLGYQVLVPLWVAVYVILFFLILLFRVQEDLFALALYVHGAYAVFWVFMYCALGLSFGKKMPAEGVAVLSSFGVATAGSILNDLFLGIPGVYALLWGATIVVWVVSAFYARRQPVPGREVNLAA